MSFLLAQTTMGALTTESFCLEYLSGATRFLEIQKEILFSISILGSCRERPAFLSIKKLLMPPKNSIRVLPLMGQQSPY